MFGYSLLRTSQNDAFYYDLFNLLKAFNVPLEGLHTETGNGVYEAAIEYTDILEAADRAVLFKTAVKEIAYKHGYHGNIYGKMEHVTCRVAAGIFINILKMQKAIIFFMMKAMQTA